MTIDLHQNSLSPFCRSVQVLAKKIGVQLNLMNVDLLKGEHRTPEFLKLNPFHSLPVLDDGGFKLVDSRAIMKYLVCAYAPDNDIYPKDLKQRALVDAMLIFDAGSLGGLAQARLVSFITTKEDLGEIVRGKVKNVLNSLELQLSRQKYAATDSLTLADIAIVHTLTLVEMQEDLTEYTRLSEYYQQVKNELGEAFKEVNEEQCEKLRGFLQSLKKK